MVFIANTVEAFMKALDLGFADTSAHIVQGLVFLCGRRHSFYHLRARGIVKRPAGNWRDIFYPANKKLFFERFGISVKSFGIMRRPAHYVIVAHTKKRCSDILAQIKSPCAFNKKFESGFFGNVYFYDL